MGRKFHRENECNPGWKELENILHDRWHYYHGHYQDDFDEDDMPETVQPRIVEDVHVEQDVL